MTQNRLCSLMGNNGSRLRERMCPPVRIPRVLIVLSTAVAFISQVSGQFAATGTTTVSVTIGAEASLQVNTLTTTLTSAGIFANYTGTTSLTYKIRTTQTTGSGTLTLRVTTDFAPTQGPSVTTPPTGGDILSYTCTVAAPGTACSGPITSSTSGSTSVAIRRKGSPLAVGSESKPDPPATAPSPGLMAQSEPVQLTSALRGQSRPATRTYGRPRRATIRSPARIRPGSFR